MRTNPSSLESRGAARSALRTILALFLLIGSWRTQAQCPITEVTTGLQGPLGITLTNKENLIVSETGMSAANTGRISIVSLAGTRRTLLSGLPSGFSVEGGEYSGPAGIFLRGRTLYLAIGVGDAVIAGPSAGTTIPNPNPSSPLFSSVLAIHFSAATETTTTGFSLTAANQQTLANRQPVTLTNGNDSITIELVANLPDYSPNPLPNVPDNVRNSNPFALAAVGNHLYLTNGGQNIIQQVNLTSGTFSTLATFPPIPNPLPFGPPVIDAVPTGILYSDGKLLVTLFRGFPFPPNSSVVEQIDPATGSHTPLINSGLKTAIGVLPIRSTNDTDSAAPNYLVLQHSSGNILDGPGVLARFPTPAGPPTVIANCQIKPTSMTLDSSTSTLYLAEITGRITSIPIDATAFEAFGFDLSRALAPAVLNTSTRGQVGSGDGVMIAGIILGAGGGAGNIPVLVRGIGPSLMSAGVAGTLQNPALELHDSSGSVIATNDNWKDTQQADIQATGLAPMNDLESAILSTLPPGAYTAIIRGANNTTGIGLIEVYNLTN